MYMVFGLKTTERSLGVLLVWKCPRCEADRDFHLVAQNMAFTLMHFLSVLRSKDSAYAKCATCGYDVKIAPSDASAIHPIMTLTAQFQNHSLTRDTYRECLERLDAQVVRDLIQLTDTWKCPQCGEENPLSFSQCWNCSEVTDATDPPDPTDSGPRPNAGLGRGGNPWE